MERVRELLRSDEGGGARALGGLLLAAGVIVLSFRRTAFAEPWGDGPIFWLFFVTAAFLYGTGFAGARLSPVTHAWQRVYVAFGLLLMPLAGLTFVEWVGGGADAPLNTAWVFLLTAIAGFAAALIAGVRWGCLLGGIALIISWLGVWAELLDGLGGDFGTLRGLLAVIGLILLGIAALVAVRGRPEGGGSDVVTAAGIAGIAAGAISLGALIGAPFLVQPITPGFAPTGSGIDTSLFWDVELLVVSLGLLAYAGVTGVRGPGYVGAIGLLAFIYVVGYDLDDSSPAGKVVGWPLVLLLAGAALFVISVLPALRRRPD